MFKTKTTIEEPERPDLVTLSPKIDAMRASNTTNDNKPFHLMFLSGFAHRFFE